MTVNTNSVFNALSGDRSQRADEMHRMFIHLGVNFASGVPCGVLRHIIKNFEDDLCIDHIPANRESEAVGIAAGAYLGGKTPVIYMQTSGFFAASNDIASLLIPYQIPILCVVSYRGCEGEDAVQHLTTGIATEPLIKAFGMPYLLLGEQSVDTAVSFLFDEMRFTQMPAVLLLKRGWHQ